MPRGLLLFAHGARDPRWALPFEAVAERARARGRAAGNEVRVVLGFLEFMQPDLLGAGEALADGGCTSVEVVPLFLGAGGHVRKDLPLLMEQLRERYPAVRWTLRPAIGESEAVVDAMASVAIGWLLPECRGGEGVESSAAPADLP